MQFRGEFKDKIRGGIITASFRYWKRPQVKSGGIYRLSPADAIEVTAIENANLAALTDGDARAAGFATLAEMTEFLVPFAGERQLFRVDFRYLAQAPDPRIELRNEPLSTEDLDALLRRLDNMDVRANDGPWTHRVLALIAKHPDTRAGDLAAKVGIETPAFKARVRRLKALGLTESREVGYRLAPRGVSFLAHMKKSTDERH
jgi:hypothetical protein